MADFDPNKQYQVLEYEKPNVPSTQDENQETVADTQTFDPTKKYEVLQYDRPMQEPVTGFQYTALTPEQEQEYQNFMNTDPKVLSWKDKFRRKYGEYPDTENTNYDYRGAWQAGVVPEEIEGDTVPHWGSFGMAGKPLKSPDHPTRWKSDYFELTGEDPDQTGVTKESAMQAMKAEGINVDNYVTATKLTDQEYRIPLNKLRDFNPKEFDYQVDSILQEENPYDKLPMPKKKAPTGSFVGDMGEKMASGAIKFGRSTFRIPDFLYDVAEQMPEFAKGLGQMATKYGNELASLLTLEDEEARKKRFEKIKDQPEIKDKQDLPDFRFFETIADNPFTETLDKASAKLDVLSDRYDKSVEYYFSTGQYGDAAGAAILGASESFIPSIAAGFTGGTGLTVMGLAAAADKKAELDKVDNLSESTKVANSVLTGASEYLTEKIGTHAIGGMIKNYLKTFGKEATEEVVRNTFKGYLKTIYKKLGLYTAPVREGSTEAANKYAENWIDKLTGVNPDVEPFDGVFDAFAIGAITGAPATGFQAVGDVIKGTRKNTKEAEREMFDQIVADKYNIPQPPPAEQQEQQIKAISQLQEKVDYLSQQGVDPTQLTEDQITTQYEQLKKQEDAEEQQSRPMRTEGAEVREVEGKLDQDLPKVDRTKLQDRKKVEEPKKEITKPKPGGLQETFRKSKNVPTPKIVSENEVGLQEVPKNVVRQGPKDYTPNTDQLAKPEVKDDDIIKDDQRFRNLPPERQVEQDNRINSGQHFSKLVSQLQKAFPEIKVITDAEGFDQVASKQFKNQPKPTGFIYQGEIYIDPRKAKDSTPVEEFAHIWLNLAKSKKKSVYNLGLNLVKDTPYYEAVIENKAYADLTTERKQEEALAKAIADQGVKIANQSAFKNFIGTLSSTINAPLRKMGFIKPIQFFEDDLKSYTSKVSKELLGQIPISKVTSEQMNMIREKKMPGGVQVQASLLNGENWASQATSWGRRLFSTNAGAGQTLAEKVNKTKSLINSHVKKGQFIINDFDKQLKNYINSLPKNQRTKRTNEVLDQVQTALTSEKELDSKQRIYKMDLPLDIRHSVYRMRSMVDGLTRKLQDGGVLVDEDLREILNKNLGTYLTRSYAMHDVANYEKNFRKYMNDKQYADIINYLTDKYSSSKVKKIRYEKVKDGIAMTFTNPYGITSETGTVSKLEDLKDVFSPTVFKNLTEAYKENPKGEITLQKPSKKQNVLPFGLTEEDINNTIIKSLIGQSGSAEKIVLGKPLNDMGLGSFETNILKKKKDIDEPIRILMGEYTDPRVNFVKTITKMASLLEKGKLENEMYEIGKGIIFTNQPTAVNTVQLKKSPLRGLADKELWTTPEIKELLSPERGISNTAIQHLVFLNGITKAALTVGKDDSQARNFWGAAMNLLATGHAPVYLGASAKIAFSDATQGQKAASLMSSPLAITLGAGSTFSNLSKEQTRKLYLDAVEHGIIGESPTVGILNDILDRIKQSKDPRGRWDKIKSSSRKTIELAAKPYQAADDIFKLSQYYQEINEFKKIYPDKSINEIKEIAARKVRLMQPIYSISPKAVRLLSRNPLAGSFVMFTTQMYRTRVNIANEAGREIREGRRTKNPALVRLGMRRLTNMLTMSVIIPTFAAVSNARMGWSDDDDDAQDWLAPNYSKYTTRIYLDPDKKNPLFLDLSFIDPVTDLREPIIALMKGEDVSDRIGNFTGAITDPFLSTEIFTQRLLDLYNNTNAYGGEIVKESMPDMEKTGRRMYYAGEVLIPGVFKSAANIGLGAIEYETDYGKVYDLANELMNSRLGVKIKERDNTKTFKSKIKNYYHRMEAARKLYAAEKGEKALVKLYSTEERYKQMSELSDQYFADIQEGIQSMLALDYSPQEIKEIFNELVKSRAISRNFATQVLNGEFYGINEKTGKWKTLRDIRIEQRKKTK